MRFKVGDEVIVVRGSSIAGAVGVGFYYDIGDRGVIIEDDYSKYQPYKVMFEDGEDWWVYKDEVEFSEIVESPLYQALK